MAGGLPYQILDAPPAQPRRLDLRLLWAALLIGAAFLVRLVLLAHQWPLLLSDEATMGLEARHIAVRGEHPIFLYGQNYMGTIEAYLAAPIFQLAGSSLFALRLGLLVLFTLFLAALYALIRLLYGHGLALLAVAVASLGSYDVLINEIEADGGYAETLFFGTLICLLAVWLLCATTPRARLARWAAYAVCGLAIGLGLWSDALILPFVLGAVALLLCCPLPESSPHRALLLLAGAVIGAMPLIAYNLTAAPGQDSVHTLLALNAGQRSPGAQLLGTLLVALPTATGGSTLCALSPHAAWPFSLHAGTHTLACDAVHAAWSLGLLLLWGSATLGAAGCLASDVPLATRRRQLCRLLLLGCAAFLVVAFALNPIAAQRPKVSARYLLPLLIVMTAVLASLVPTSGIRLGRRLPLPFRLATLLRIALLAGFLAVNLAGTVATFGLIDVDAPARRQQQDLLAALLRRHLDRLYTDYWTCDRLIFQSGERIICAVLDAQLRPGLDRYTPYRDLLGVTPYPAYLFPAGSPQALALLHGHADPRRRYPCIPALSAVAQTDGYLIMAPCARGDVP